MLLLSVFSRLTACCTHPVRGTPVQVHLPALTPPAVDRRNAHLPLQGLLVSLS